MRFSAWNSIKQKKLGQVYEAMRNANYPKQLGLHHSAFYHLNDIVYQYLLQPSEKDTGRYKITDLRADFHLAVNIISANDLNYFVAVKKPCEPQQGF